MKKLSKTTLKKIEGGAGCKTLCRESLNACKAMYAGTPNIELCWDQFFICLESCA
jgi:bacteriocin-like protein